MGNGPHKFVDAWNAVERSAHSTSRKNGWWEEPCEHGTRIALIHSELSEALEALRKHNPHSEKIPEFSGLEEELADVVIRIMDYAGGFGLRVPEAILAKVAFNRTRPHRHGDKAF